MKKFDSFLQKMIRVCDSISTLFLVACFFVMILQVIVRYIFGFSFPWAEELARFLIIYGVFFVAVGIYRRGEHPKVEILYDVLPEGVRYVLNYVFYAIMTAFLLFLVVYGYRLCATTIKPLTVATRIPKAIPFAAVGLGSLLTIFQSVGLCRDNYLRHKKYLAEEDEK